MAARLPEDPGTRRSDLPAWPTWPHYSEEEVEAAAAVLRSGRVNYWTGPENGLFEDAFAARFGTRHAIAAGNGTFALDLALIALGIGHGDEVVVTPRSYFASTSCVVLAGAKPVFADIDPDSQNLTADSIARVLTPKTRAIVPVHLAGWPCDMTQIMALARAHNLLVIEDCAQAHGARIDGHYVGSFGDASAYSFCQDKIMTTGGEGGMFVTSATDVWERAWAYKDHGKSRARALSQNHPPGFRWLHETVGTNYRMTGMQAAIGSVQLGKLDAWLAARRDNAAVYHEVLGGLDALRTPAPPAGIEHAYYKFYTFVRPHALKSGWDRDRIMGTLAERGVPSFSGSCPEIYLEKSIADRGLAPENRLPVARELGETSLMFLLHPTLSTQHIARMADMIREVVAEGTRR